MPARGQAETGARAAQRDSTRASALAGLSACGDAPAEDAEEGLDEGDLLSERDSTQPLRFSLRSLQLHQLLLVPLLLNLLILKILLILLIE